MSFELIQWPHQFERTTIAVSLAVSSTDWSPNSTTTSWTAILGMCRTYMTIKILWMTNDDWGSLIKRTFIACVALASSCISHRNIFVVDTRPLVDKRRKLNQLSKLTSPHWDDIDWSRSFHQFRRLDDNLKNNECHSARRDVVVEGLYGQIEHIHNSNVD